MSKLGACVIFAGSLDKGGYGYLRYNGKRWSAHRLAYFMAFGEIPLRLLVCHKCDDLKIAYKALRAGDTDEQLKAIKAIETTLDKLK